MNISQARRLNRLGIFLNKGIPVGYDSAEKQMMELLGDKVHHYSFTDGAWNVGFSNTTYFVRHSDLTEALIQACEAVLKEKEGR